MTDGRPSGTWKNTPWWNRCPSALKENFSRDQSQATLDVIVAWGTGDAQANGNQDGRAQALLDFVGWTSVVNGGGQAFYHRDIPFPHPKFSNYIYCDGISFAEDVPTANPTNPSLGAVDDLGLPLGDDAFATLHFWAPPFLVLSDALMLLTAAFQGNPAAVDEAYLVRYVSGRMEPKGRFQTLPAFQALQFDSAGGPSPPAPAGTHKPVTATWAFLVPEGQLEVTHYEIPITPTNYIPYAAIENCVGKCNGLPLGSLASPIGLFRPGSLGYNWPTISKPYRMVNGNFAVDITHRFLCVRSPGPVINGVTYFPGVNGIFQWDVVSGPTFQPVSRDGNTLVDPGGSGAIRLDNGAVGDPNQLLFPPAFNSYPPDFAGLFRPGP